MFQYDASVPGGYGGGGEYEVQMGFGWTNGVILELLDKYGDRISLKDDFTDSGENKVMSSSRKWTSSHFTIVIASSLALLARHVL